MSELQDDPLFDLYQNHRKSFQPFIEKNRAELQGILDFNIASVKALVTKECLNTDPKPVRVKQISEICASYAGMSGINDQLRRKFRAFAREVDENLIRQYSLSAWSEHWKNVAFYSFVILYLDNVTTSKLEPNKC